MPTAKSPLPPDFAFDEAAIAAAAERLRAAGVADALGVWTDVHGHPKAKVTPISCFEKLCRGAELYTVGAVEGLGLAGPHEDECAAVPDPATAVVCPWDKKKAWMHADLWHHGAPFAGDPRGILKRALDRAASMGLTFHLGIEPEFYVLREDAETGRLVPITSTRFEGPNACYDLRATVESDPFLAPMARHLEDLGWGLYSYDQECGRGQHEFDFGHADALTSADRLVFFRFLASEVARSIGAVAVFEPKPFADDFRSGAHFNMSLVDGNGVNLFDREARGTGDLAATHGLPLPDAAYHFTAGLLKHAAAITAVGCPAYNSYQGLIAQGALSDFSWAPVIQAYGDNNRSAMVRAPLNRPCIENRAVDVSVNPHLAAALMLHAGLDGIEQGLDPGSPFNTDLYRFDKQELRARGVHTLPPTLLHAIDAFEADPISELAFGSYKQTFLAFGHKRWERAFFAVDPPRAPAPAAG
ncbi:glutamine synthetase [Phycisphaera mikurensis]|nr:glutamine synthetase [Phycisphaera mikurensis]MBB6441290.1 glutamine synthetase [Phycisphaera mikurensis]